MVEAWAKGVNERQAGKVGAADGNVDFAGKVDVAEVYSPPRITIEAKKFGLKPGEAMDLMTGYDFNLEADRKKAWDYIRKENRDW